MWHHFLKLALIKPSFLDLMNLYCLLRLYIIYNFAEAGKLPNLARGRIIRNSMPDSDNLMSLIINKITFYKLFLDLIMYPFSLECGLNWQMAHVV